jgi:NAD(P)-dependent dehydrogenase (short-subunit alcohol dehydrogenase family)
MQNKVVLITGGTGGIGKQTAIGLAKLGAHVVINGRNAERGEKALAEIREASGTNHVDLLLADMSLRDDVYNLAQAFKQRFSQLDVLINNAGHLPQARKITKDGMETAFAVNVVAPFLLTHLLLDMLKMSRPARIINLAGGLPFGKIDLENLQAQKSFSSFGVYSHTKRAMLAVSLALAKRLEGTGVTINVAYPGRAETAMVTGEDNNTLPFVFRLLAPVANRFVPHGEITVIRAAQSSIYLASSPEVEAVSGGYFNPQGKPWKMPAAAHDEATQTALLNMLEQFHTAPISESQLPA